MTDEEYALQVLAEMRRMLGKSSRWEGYISPRDETADEVDQLEVDAAFQVAITAIQERAVLRELARKVAKPDALVGQSGPYMRCSGCYALIPLVDWEPGEATPFPHREGCPVTLARTLLGIA